MKTKILSLLTIFVLVFSISGYAAYQTTTGFTGAQVDAALIKAVGMTTNDYTVTATVIVATSDNGKIFANSEAANDVTYSLYECAASTDGFSNGFLVTDTDHELYIDPNAADQILVKTNTAGDKLQGDKVLGSIMVLRCIKDDAGDYNWMPIGWIGSWTDAD